MYCEYWNLNKPPFDNVPDPSMYVDSHISMENVIAETIFAIKEGNECFAVIIGDIGLGKTLSLRIIIDSLEQDKYKIALITNPSISFIQLLKEIIGQISGKQCEEKRKVDLLEIFNHLLFETADSGQKIVIFIDEANAISPANLENLRLLTNMQDDHRNLFTLVLAGQMELARRLEHPKRANLFQRIGTYSRIDKLPSEDAVKSYMETRLKLAGVQKKIFDDKTIHVIWEYSDQGVPRLINKICKLCLKAGETNELLTISAEVAAQIGERFQRLSKTALQQRKPRSRPGMGTFNEDIALISGSGIGEESIILPSLAESQISMQSSEADPENRKKLMTTEASTRKIQHDVPDREINNFHSGQEVHEEVLVGKHKIILTIPSRIMEQSKLSDRDSQSKLAGYWAAQIVKENPLLTNSPLVDPVSIWHELKGVIIKKINSNLITTSATART
jgi:type II secretory pathway predicted ATPase ExeA